MGKDEPVECTHCGAKTEQKQKPEAMGAYQCGHCDAIHVPGTGFSARLIDTTPSLFQRLAAWARRRKGD